MHPAVLSRLVDEIAPRIAGAGIVDAYWAGSGCLIVELSSDAELSSGAGPSSAARSPSDGRRFLGIVTLKAMPLVFLAERDEHAPTPKRQPRQGIERELVGATIVALVTEEDAVAALAFRKTQVTGRTVERVLSVDLGRRPRLAVRDAATARDEAAAGRGARAAPDSAIDDGRPIVAWRHDRDTPYVPSPLLYGERLYFLKKNNGILSAFDAGSGEAHYGPVRLEGIEGVYASPVGAAGRVYIAGRNGATLVIEDGDEFKVLATNRLDDSFSASPAVVGDAIFLRGLENLYCIAE